MTKRLFVHRHHAFTSKKNLLICADVTPEEADSAHFSYSGKTPAILWRVYGPHVDLITDNRIEALSRFLAQDGAGTVLSQVNVWTSEALRQRDYMIHGATSCVA